VIFTADHGVEPGKASVYARGMRVPLIVDWPGLTPPGSVTESLAQHVDLTATMARAAGVPNIGKTMDGVDLRPVFRNPKQTVRDYAYFECGYSRGITDGRYKLISTRLPDAVIADALAGKYTWMTVGMGGGAGAHAAFSQRAYPDYYKPDQLYDFKRDPYEQASLWNNPELASVQARLCQALAATTKTMPFAFPVDAQPFFESETYKNLAERTRRENDPNKKPWVKRDHDAIVWPPKGK
jgi:arylsulfatase A-like enzyme